MLVLALRALFGAHGIFTPLALVIVTVIVIVIGFVAEDDLARFFGISRSSAMECSAIIDCCGVIGAAEHHDAEEANALLEHAVAMLTRMCR